MQDSKSSAKGHSTSMRVLSRDGMEVLDDIAAFIRRYLVCDDAWERCLPASSIPVESQSGMVSNGQTVPAGMLPPSSGASSGRISLIGAGPGGPEEPEE